MRKTKLILTVALIAAVSLTVVSVTGNVKTNNTEKSTEVSEEQKSGRTQYIKEKLTEKMEAGEIEQEKYNEIMEAIESGEFGGNWGPRGSWGNAGKMTDEQKAEIKEKIKENLTEQLEAGEITQEKYDEIISGIESGEFGGNWGPRGNWGNAGEMTDEQKAEIKENIKDKIIENLTEKLEAGEITQEKYDEIISGIESGEFDGNWGPRGNWGNAGEMTDEQKATIAEKRAEMMEKGGFGGFGGFRGYRGNDDEVSE